MNNQYRLLASISSEIDVGASLAIGLEHGTSQSASGKEFRGSYLDIWHGRRSLTLEAAWGEALWMRACLATHCGVLVFIAGFCTVQVSRKGAQGAIGKETQHACSI